MTTVDELARFYDTDAVIAAGFRKATGVEELSVGQTVVAYSRGAFRVAEVEKVGRKNVTVFYRTEGGFKETANLYHKYRAMLAAPDVREAFGFSTMMKRECSNRAYAAERAAAGTSHRYYHESDDLEDAAKRAAETDESIRARVEAKVDERIAYGRGFVDRVDEVGALALSHVTTKTVAATSVFVPVAG